MFILKIEKLEDVLLENVSGGATNKAATDTAIVITVAGISVGLGFGIAGLICQKKANQYQSEGNEVKAEKYKKSSEVMNCVAIGGSGAAALGFASILAIAGHNKKSRK